MYTYIFFLSPPRSLVSVVNYYYFHPSHFESIHLISFNGSQATFSLAYLFSHFPLMMFLLDFFSRHACIISIYSFSFLQLHPLYSNQKIIWAFLVLADLYVTTMTIVTRSLILVYFVRLYNMLIHNVCVYRICTYGLM